MDPLEINVSGTANTNAPQIITLNNLCLKVSMKICPTVKRWTCTGCTQMCTSFCTMSEEDK